VLILVRVLRLLRAQTIMRIFLNHFLINSEMKTLYTSNQPKEFTECQLTKHALDAGDCASRVRHFGAFSSPEQNSALGVFSTPAPAPRSADANRWIGYHIEQSLKTYAI